MMIKILPLCFLLFSTSAMSSDVISYNIKRKLSDNIEVREYNNLLLAKISSDQDISDNKLFRSLFKFISGENNRKQEIKMTSPVLQEKKGGKITMSFVMPKDFNEANLPKPNDKNIKIENIKNQKFIVINFSGRSSDSNFVKYQEILLDKIKKENIDVDLTNPIKAYYNNPWTLPFFKKNEILFKLKNL